MCRTIAGVLAMMLAVATTAQGQTAEGQGSSTSPFFGSATQGTVSATPIDLSVKDAVERALQFNLGLLLQEEEAKLAHGARWRARRSAARHLDRDYDEPSDHQSRGV